MIPVKERYKTVLIFSLAQVIISSFLFSIPCTRIRKDSFGKCEPAIFLWYILL